MEDTNLAAMFLCIAVGIAIIVIAAYDQVNKAWAYASDVRTENLELKSTIERLQSQQISSTDKTELLRLQDEILELDRNASKGPWEAYNMDEFEGVVEPSYHYYDDTQKKVAVTGWWITGTKDIGNGECGAFIEADAKAMARFRTLAPLLVDRCVKFVELLERCQMLIDTPSPIHFGQPVHNALEAEIAKIL